MFKRNLLSVIFIVVITTLFAETWIYEKEVVIIPIGEEEHEIRLNYTGVDMTDGPTSFAIDEDENIYIKTSRKNILKKFDKNGKYICSSKFEKGLGDGIRFIGYQNNVIYTMSGNAQNPVIRRYSKELNLIDCHKIKKDYERQWIGLFFISNYKGDFGLLSNSNPKNISFKKIDLQDNNWQMRGTKLMDFEYEKVDLKKIWSTEIGYRFINFDYGRNLYFEIYNKPKTGLGIMTETGKAIDTNIEFDRSSNNGLSFSDRAYPFVSRDGIIYQLLPFKDRMEFIKWHITGVEK